MIYARFARRDSFHCLHFVVNDTAREPREPIRVQGIAISPT
jgi:hypothetical protein